MTKVKDAQLLMQQARLEKEELYRYGLVAISLLIVALMIILILNQRNFRKQNLAETEKLLAQLELLKANRSMRRLKKATSSPEKFEINMDCVNSAAHNRLNGTDWKILSLICDRPTTSNKDIAEAVLLSVGGVKSCFNKMYDLFELTASSRNKKLALALRVMKISENTPEDSQATIPLA